MTNKLLCLCTAYIALLLGVSAPVQAADPIYSIQMSDADNATCAMNISGQGTMKFLRACHEIKKMSFLTVISLPSTATVLVTPGSCYESTEGQDWWVKLESTTRHLSTERLNVTQLVNIASAWQGPQSSVYVAPYLKVTGFGQKKQPTPDAEARCVMVTLPVTPEARHSVMNIKMVPPKEQDRDGGKAHSCEHGPIVVEYRPSTAATPNVNCLELRDSEDNLYVVEPEREYNIELGEDPFQCPSGQAIVGQFARPAQVFPIGRSVTCGYIKNSKTSAPLKLSRSEPSEKNEWRNSLSLCDDPAVGMRQRIWNTNHVPTGIEVQFQYIRYWCSKFSE